LREALFSMLGDRIEGARVADLFAGTGLLGLEALSRGATHALFVEIDPRMVRVLRQNANELGLDPARVDIQRGDARRWLRRFAAETCPGPQGPSLLLMDPPYREGELASFLLPVARLVESARLTACVIEHPHGETPSSPSAAPSVRLITRVFGQGAFTLIERTEDP
jgi:16S rRNA (guanine966-N2)-methyltransferase